MPHLSRATWSKRWVSWASPAMAGAVPAASTVAARARAANFILGILLELRHGSLGLGVAEPWRNSRDRLGYACNRVPLDQPTACSDERILWPTNGRPRATNGPNEKGAFVTKAPIGEIEAIWRVSRCACRSGRRLRRSV